MAARAIRYRFTRAAGVARAALIGGMACALFSAGCASWIDPDSALRPARAGAAAAKSELAPSPPRCVPFPAGPTDVPAVAELRAALGAAPDSEVVRALFAKLGGAPKIYLATDGNAYDFPDRGLRFVFVDRGGGLRLRGIELLARMEQHASYAGALPDGLRLDLESEGVDAALGGPADGGRCIGFSDCIWRARGLAIEYAGVCIGSIELVEAAAPGTVTVAEIAAKDGAVVEDEHGLQLAVTTIVGRDFPGPRSLGAPLGFDVVAHLVDDGGATLAETHAFFSKWGENTEKIFFPYREIKAPPGPLHARVELTSSAAPLHAAAAFPVAFAMAQLVKVRVNVAHVEVEPGVYDNTRRTNIIVTVLTGGAIPPLPLPRRWERPDLFWTISPSGVTSAADGWRSSVHDDVYAASWRQKSPWVTLAQGDPLDVCIEDEDPGSAECIACIRKTPEELRAAAAAHRPLAQDQVTRLVLGSVEIR